MLTPRPEKINVQEGTINHWGEKSRIKNRKTHSQIRHPIFIDLKCRRTNEIICIHDKVECDLILLQIQELKFSQAKLSRRIAGNWKYDGKAVLFVTSKQTSFFDSLSRYVELRSFQSQVSECCYRHCRTCSCLLFLFLANLLITKRTRISHPTSNNIRR